MTAVDVGSKAPTSPAPSPATRCTISAASSPSRARSCPATSSPPTRAPAWSTWRPTMARTISSCARRNGIDPVFAVEGDGKYRDDWAVARRPGQRHQRQVQRARRPDLHRPARGRRAARGERDFQHSYPHSWRSKAKVIYRCTPQWFVAMDRPLAHASPRAAPSSAGTMRAAPTPRRHADAAPDSRSRPSPTPASSPKRAATASARWSRAGPTGCSAASAPGACRSPCSSSARPANCWSTPRSTRASSPPSASEGVDAWDEANARAHSSGDGRNPDDYEMVTDILDVWFDSGCTHVFTLESGDWPEQRWPADLYLEGSRPASRLVPVVRCSKAAATRGRAPLRRGADPRLHHGRQGHENVQEPGQHGQSARSHGDLWRRHHPAVGAVGRFHRGPPHRRGDPRRACRDQYRKLRNTFRYLLGALDGFSEDERVDDVAAYARARALHAARCWPSSTQQLRTAVDDFDFNAYVRALTDFCNEDLSAFYFDIRKDCLYCDAPGRSQAPRLSHRARHPVPRAGALARAGAGVHHRGSVGHALSRTRGSVHLLRMAGSCPTWLDAPTARAAGPSFARCASR